MQYKPGRHGGVIRLLQARSTTGRPQASEGDNATDSVKHQCQPEKCSVGHDVFFFTRRAALILLSSLGYP